MYIYVNIKSMDCNFFDNAEEQGKKVDQKVPIFVSRTMLDQMKEFLPFKLYDQLELRYELGFMHDVLGHKNYKEEVETIMKAKRGLSVVPTIEYNIIHK